MVIDNKLGAVEILGATTVAQAKPDGYTLLMSTEAALETNQFLYSKLPYDPVKDFTPITRLVEGPYIYVVRNDEPGQEHRTGHTCSIPPAWRRSSACTTCLTSRELRR